MNTSNSSKYEFNLNQEGFSCKKTNENLFKWGISESMQTKQLTYDRLLFDTETDINDFLLDVLNSSFNKNIKNVEFDKLKTTLTSLSFFDRLFDNKIARKGGKIIQCFDEYTEFMVFLK